MFLVWRWRIFLVSENTLFWKCFCLFSFGHIFRTWGLLLLWLRPWFRKGFLILFRGRNPKSFENFFFFFLWVGQWLEFVRYLVLKSSRLDEAMIMGSLWRGGKVKSRRPFRRGPEKKKKTRRWEKHDPTKYPVLGAPMTIWITVGVFADDDVLGHVAYSRCSNDACKATWQASMAFWKFQTSWVFERSSRVKVQVN